MRLNCGVGEDSWESLGLQGNPTSQSSRKSFLNIHWKDWCWSWSSNTLATWWEELTPWKRPNSWKDWRQKEKRTTEDEMVGWHYQLDGHEFEQDLGAGEGQGSLVCYSPWVAKHWTWQSNWTKLMVFPVVMYRCESWTRKKAEHWRIDAFKLRCWRRLLRVPWTARRSNQSILKKINPGYASEGLILKVKLHYFGHLMWRTNSLEKTLMQSQIVGHAWATEQQK